VNRSRAGPGNRIDLVESEVDVPDRLAEMPRRRRLERRELQPFLVEAGQWFRPFGVDDDGAELGS
jgi:hypothetical protein